MHTAAGLLTSFNLTYRAVIKSHAAQLTAEQAVIKGPNQRLYTFLVNNNYLIYLTSLQSIVQNAPQVFRFM